MPAREYRWRHLALLISILLLFVVAPRRLPLASWHADHERDFGRSAGGRASTPLVNESTCSPSLSCYRQSQLLARTACRSPTTLGPLYFPFIHYRSRRFLCATILSYVPRSRA